MHRAVPAADDEVREGPASTFLVPWYLRSPVKPLAGQMLVVASR